MVSHGAECYQPPFQPPRGAPLFPTVLSHAPHPARGVLLRRNGFNGGWSRLREDPLWEGMTYYSIGRTRIRSGKVEVDAHVECVEGGKSYLWTIRLMLDRAGRDWVVADIGYADGDGTMLAAILERLADIDRHIAEERKRK